ncbi:MAG TPA: proton-conducting transporter membrane subunit [Streptosporangiaceae bacterium]|nr:proton-conducting transporter membrane subunit [Streptosporangiaceae bacterium]
MIALALLIVAGPLAGPVAALAKAKARVAGMTGTAGALVSLAAAIALLGTGLHRTVNLQAWNGFIYIDGLGEFFLLTVSLVTVLAAIGSIGYLSAEEDKGTLSAFQVRLYFVFFGLFASLMLASLETGNLGLLFVLVEGSTLASAALVGLEGKARSLEAAWKYVIISSLGVTIALAGTLFLFYAGTALHLGSDQRLTWPYLFAHAAMLAPQPLRLAFLLAVVGYGTKVGLAPMHTWLPDAHAEAPSPASAMLSAALLNTGMYAIIRFQAITAARLGTGFPRAVLLSFGFASVLIGVLFMVRRGNFKRLFAYSSVEHMGIIAVALGFGGLLGLYGALLHTINHAVAKAVLFLGSGDIALRYRTREATGVGGLMTAAPAAGAALLLGSLAVLGSPPFGLFLSEFTIVRAGFERASPVFPLLLLGLLAVAFIAFARTTTGMITGAPAPAPAAAQAPDQAQAPADPYQGRAARLSAIIPVAAGLALLLVLGLWIPAGLNTAIMHSLAAIT